MLQSDEVAHLESEVLRSRDRFELAWSAWRVIEEYCDFFRDARALNRTLANGHCNRENMRSQRARLAPRDALVSLLEPNTWNSDEDKNRESGAFGDFSSMPAPVAAPSRAATRPALANTWIEALEIERRSWQATPARGE